MSATPTSLCYIARMLHVALYHPAIPQNTGNIGRLCVGMNAALHLIEPGFDVDDKACRRAGLDYWPNLTWHLYDSDQAFIDWLSDGDPSHAAEPWLVTKFATQHYHEATFADGDVLLMGNENTGLPDAWHDRWPNTRISIPILGPIRSYNLANATAMVLSHARMSLNTAV